MQLIIIYFTGPNCGNCAYYSRRLLPDASVPSDHAPLSAELRALPPPSPARLKSYKSTLRNVIWVYCGNFAPQLIYNCI